jgi:hypothetical protein
MLLRLLILNYRSSACSRNAFAVSAKHGNSEPTFKRNAVITRAGFDSFADPTATYRCALQKFESAVDRTRSDGRSRLGHCNRSA